MSTWAECIAEVRDALSRGGDLSDTLIDSHLQAAQQFVLNFNQRDWFWLEEIKDAVLATNQTQITEPADIIDTIGLEVSDDLINWTPLQIFPYAVLGVNFNSDERGRPLFYARQGGLFYLFPGTDKQYYFRIHYKRRLNNISGGQSSPLTTTYKYALVWRACETLAATVLLDGNMTKNYAGMLAEYLTMMEDEDERRKLDIWSGMVQPDRYYETLADPYMRQTL